MVLTNLTHESIGRRVKRMRVVPEFLIFLGSGTFEVLASALPRDARFAGAGYDSQRGLFYIDIESDSYEETAWGQEIVLLESPVIRQLADPFAPRL